MSLIRPLVTALPALSHRNFRLFLAGQCISLIGTWMQNVALAWLVLKLTNSPLLLGLASAIQFLPVMLFSLIAGPFVDRFPKKKMLMFTQSALMVLALVLFVLTEFRTVQYWQLIVLSFLLGIVNTLDIPTRQSFVIEMVGKEHLTNAISLNSSIFNLARVAGPAVAGIMIAMVGIAPCFLINTVSFIAVLVALSQIDVPPIWTPLPEGKENLRGIWESMKEGLSYIAARPVILLPILLLGLLSTFVINYNIVVPLFAQRELGGDSIHFGLLMTAMGIGSLLAALTLALRSSKAPSPMMLAVSAVSMSAFFVLAGFQKDFLVSCLILGLVGYFTVFFSASCNAHVQIKTEDRMRGRVMSVFALVFGGVTPIGSFYTGQIAESFGVRFCMIVSGGIGLLASLGIGASVLLIKGKRKNSPEVLKKDSL